MAPKWMLRGPRILRTTCFVHMATCAPVIVHMVLWASRAIHALLLQAATTTTSSLVSTTSRGRILIMGLLWRAAAAAAAAAEVIPVVPGPWKRWEELLLLPFPPQWPPLLVD
jgi:hypothetical protein